MAEVARRHARVTGDAMVRRRERLTQLERLHATLGYEATLKRGYAVVHGDGHVATSVATAKGAASLEIEFADGRLGVAQADAPKRTATRRKPIADDGSDQGSLF